MSSTVEAALVAIGVAILPAHNLRAQADSVRVHVERARAAANGPGATLFTLCPAVPGIVAPTVANPPFPPVAGRPTWYAEPHKVFDNLYWVGQTEYSSWALTTSAGIIVIDAIFDYSVEAEVADGLKKLGLDPAAIKYVIISHAHSDHSGGARYLQEHFGAKIILSEADWDLLARSGGNSLKPQRDIVATDGYKVTLGDAAVTLYLTPGHTPGTLSSIFQVTDNGQKHTVAAWGGTAFNFTITPDKPREYWFDTYIHSAERFRDIVKQSGADVMVANHTNFDMSKVKLPALATRRAGEPNPYIVGSQGIADYLTVAAECARAAQFAARGR